MASPVKRYRSFLLSVNNQYRKSVQVLWLMTLCYISFPGPVPGRLVHLSLSLSLCCMHWPVDGVVEPTDS